MLRIAKGYSIKELSDVIGIKPNRITDFEYGKHGRGKPKADELFKIATEFGVTPEDIVFKNAKVILA